MPQKKAAEKKGIDDKKDDVRGESNQEKEKQFLVQLEKSLWERLLLTWEPVLT